MILLDTHVIFWLLTTNERLSVRAHDLLLQAHTAGEEIVYSPVSLYEIAYVAHRNRMLLNSPIEAFVKAIQSQLEMVALTAEIVVCAAKLPDTFHGDPIDRIITATAIVMDCPLITKDEKIREANLCKVVW
ncbi:MAG: type II toxin-antitoxin system VapC family toxin [Terracidiphilus sp.]